MGLRAFGPAQDMVSLFLEGNGPLMLLVGSVVGAGFAGVLFATTVVGLPLLLEKEIDFVTAMIHSTRTALANPVVMLVWGCVIAVFLFLAMLPLFMGLFVALPVLGHATWHMYRRAMAD